MATQPEDRTDAFAKMPGSFRERYSVLRSIGRGGMGEVFLAEDQLLRRQVVLKRLAPFLFGRSGADQAALRQQLLTEAKRSSAIRSPYIVQIYDVCSSEDDLVLVLEYVNGGNLRDLVSRPMTVPRFLPSAIEMAEAIRAAHAASILHCDIKPENILRDEAGTIKVADFGLARAAIKDCADAATVSLPDAASSLCGTPGYMAPEVLEGNSPTEQSDIFSLGIVYYEMLSGRNPVKGKGLTQTIDQTLHGPIPPIADVNSGASPALQHVLNKMLARDPEERYATVRDLLIDLRGLERSGDHHGSHQFSQTALPAKHLALGGAIFFGLAILTVAILAAALWPIWNAQQKKPAAQSEPAPPPTPQLLAVIPFKVTGGGDQLSAFAEGLRNTVTSSLARASAREPLEILAAS
ncbi:MAG TPA: serine/threonine-protein kinase, partial [Acidobacteriaceae bacterium]|nr:serine/threonine-protein kinase [Acidobacteriaceae bacterium]